MKKTSIILCMIFTLSTVVAQVHIPLSKTMVGFWQLNKGKIHGTEDTQGMYSVYNPDGTFYMFTISCKDSLKTSMLQCGTYVMTSDSTCNQQMVKSFTTYGAAEGQKIQIKFRMIDEKTMQWQWKLDNGSSIDASLAAMIMGNPRWNTEIWSRVE